MSSLTAPPRTDPVRAGRFTIHGEVARPLTLSVADLRRRWGQHEATVTFDCATSGPQEHRFRGPLLREVMEAVTPSFDPRRRKERARFLVAFTGGDGHHAVLSWAEFDTDFGNGPILLATRMDGTELDEAGCQLVVPTDHCGARYISAVTSVWIGTCRVPHAGP
ncbi:molybdopterin-dependent oxidoreductase [Streptomyces sp. NPDC056222]|uniref:molybdopterin-dependent oxidoreductase n=1 Tax=Streptomyces sp. NPDC056222 TaxID=3345749 RepID=UPI0035E18F26